MTLADQALGVVLIALAFAIGSYYSAWVLLTPFLPADHALHAAFPDRLYALRLPALLLTVAVTVGAAFIGIVLAAKARKAKAS